MNVVEINPSSYRDRQKFLSLPFKIYKDIPQWVPPLSFDASRIFDRKRNPFYQSGEAAFFIAEDLQGKPCGRVAALCNDKYNEFNHEQTAFFYLFESDNRPEIAQLLFERAIQWAQARGLNKLIGPKGFTTLDGMGLLVEGFEHRPAFGLPYNPPYYSQMIEAAGFLPSGDTISGYLDSENGIIPDKIRRVADLVERRRGLRVIRIGSRRELMRIIPELQKMYNASLVDTTGNIPLSDMDLKIMADQLMWFADLSLIKLIRKEDELVGFLLAYPDISAAVQRCQGRLFPFGWLDLLLELKRTRWININGAAIVDKYRGMGGTALLFREMGDSLISSRYHHADIVQIGTENERMLLELREFGIQFYKRHRMYARFI